MAEQYYALYAEGREKPFGVLRESMLGSEVEIAQSFGIKTYTKPITPEQAEKIREDITHSESLDDLFARIESERGE